VPVADLKSPASPTRPRQASPLQIRLGIVRPVASPGLLKSPCIDTSGPRGATPAAWTRPATSSPLTAKSMFTLNRPGFRWRLPILEDGADMPTAWVGGGTNAPSTPPAATCRRQSTRRRTTVSRARPTRPRECQPPEVSMKVRAVHAEPRQPSPVGPFTPSFAGWRRQGGSPGGGKSKRRNRAADGRTSGCTSSLTSGTPSPTKCSITGLLLADLRWRR
jgi:hypothetical protein